MKIVLAIFALLAIFILTTSISTVKASHVCVTWGEQTTVTNPAEVWQDSYTTAYITNIVNQGWAGYSWYAANYYGSMTTPYYVYTSNLNVKNSPSYDYLATFHVGDMYPDWKEHGHWEEYWVWNEELQDWELHFNYILDGYSRHYAYYGYAGYGTAGIEDYILESKTSWKNQFTFIWTCVNADWIIESMNMNPNHELESGFYINNYYFYDPYGTGLVGMPFAWTHDSDMAYDGYTDPDTGSMCYIGFENTSLGLCDDAEFGTSNYGDFVRAFYGFALINHMPIRTALDLAMIYNGVSGFGASWLYQGYWDDYGYYCRMHVYGNGNNILPY